MHATTLHSAILIGCIGLFAPSALAYTELEFSDEAVDLTPGDQSRADKARILDMPDGTLVVVWHAENGVAGQAWDIFGVPFAPRDIYASTSGDGGSTWTEPENISGTSGLTDPTVFYDAAGDGSGLANFYGDSDKPNVFASGNNLVVTWSDSYCGPGMHGPARYAVALGELELPYRCLYAARMTVAAGVLNVITVQQVTDAARDVTNEVLRGTGAGFAIAWQEDPNGLQLGEARGEGDGSSGARVSPGTDIWYAWIPASAFPDPAQGWRGPTAVSDNYDYATGTVQGGGASRPILAMTGSPPQALLVYEEAKNAGPADPGKHVLYHAFPYSAPAVSEPGTIVSNPLENARRARIMAQGSPGPLGTRMAIMWRQGAGIMGAPADFMMRIGRVPATTSLQVTPNAGFRVEDLWPPVEPTDASLNAAPLNLSGARLDDPSTVEPLADAKAHRAVLDGDFIFAGYTRDENVEDPAGLYRYLGRWSDDGGTSWSLPLDVSSPGSGNADVIEPRLLRTPTGSDSGKPEDIRNPDVFVFAWGTESTPGDGSEPVRESLFVTRTLDRGLTLEPVQSLDGTRQVASETDEQIQLRVTPDGQQLAAVWVRRDGERSSISFATAIGVTRTADLVLTGTATSFSPDVGEEFQADLQLRNAGPDAATDTVLAIRPGAGLSVDGVISSAGQCTPAPVIDCNFGTLDPGTSASVSLVLVAPEAGTLALNADASAREVEPAPADNEASLFFEATPNADLSLGIAASTVQATQGEDFSVDLSVANAGPQSASDVRVVVQVPGELRVTGAQGCRISAGQVDCPIPLIAPGEGRVIRILASAQSVGRASILARVTAAEKDPQAANDSDELVVNITGNLGGCVYSPDGHQGDTLLAILLIVASVRLGVRALIPRAGAGSHA